MSEYLDGSGAVAAHYEYDPFGQITVNTDTTNRFPIRFSTKWQDFETGLNYYGYRYYDPQQGRWPSRDPIKERGGLNLYWFIENDGLSSWDILGLERYGFYSTGKDSQGFKDRADQSGNSKGFGNGKGLVDNFKNSPNIDRADIHSHGFDHGPSNERGIPGADPETGFYGDQYEHGIEGSAKVGDLAEAVKNGDIDLEKDATINLYGCNTDKLAEELSKALTKAGRGDVTVTGSDDNVGPDPKNKNRARSDGNFNSYKGGNKTNSFKTLDYK